MFYRVADGCPLEKDPFKSLIVPRPIGWITSLDPDGRVNLAPFSFFNGVADDPPHVMFSAGMRPGETTQKDTWLNVEATGEFVCNMAVWELRDEMNKTASHMPHGVDEAEAAGLEMLASEIVQPPRVARSPAHLECRYVQTVRIPQGSPDEDKFYAIIIGEVVGIHIDEAILEDGRVMLAKAVPIARCGYSEYAAVREVFRMPRPS